MRQYIDILNTPVRANDYGVRPTSIESILSAETHINTTPNGVTYQFPFQNLCYRPIVRVVDFFPPKLEDFAVPVPNKSIRRRMHKCNDDDEGGNSHMIWDWRFCLLVEGRELPVQKDQHPAQMKLYVSGAEGQFLLKEDAAE